MKKHLVLLLALCMSHMSLAHAASTWALIVGVSQYQKQGITSLAYAASDATACRDVLADPKLGNVPASHIRLLTNGDATEAGIMGAVDNFLKPNVKLGDQVIVFLAGHGVTKGVGADAKGYFLPTDVQGLTKAALEGSGVDLKALSTNLARLPATQFVTFVDACREDPTPARGFKPNLMTDALSSDLTINPTGAQLEDMNHPVSAVTFFACGIGQRSFEDPTLKHGVFTYMNLQGIKSGDVPRSPTGAIEMSRLAAYVTQKVTQWSQQETQKGDFEYDQKPDIISQVGNPNGVILMRVRRPLSAVPIAPEPPTLSIVTVPEGAQVFLNDQLIGAGPVEAKLPTSGACNVRVEAPGYAPFHQSLNVLAGYGQRLVAQLQPAAPKPVTGTSTPPVSPPSQNSDLSRAMNAESERQWEIANAGYNAALAANPKEAAAWEGLARLRRREGQFQSAVAVLLNLIAQAPTARSFSLLSEACSVFAQRGPGEPGPLLSVPARYPLPRNAAEAGQMALNASQGALRLAPGSPDAQRARGLALIATDAQHQNKTPALAVLAQAVYAAPSDAVNLYALGYGIRVYAQGPNGADVIELNRAIEDLQKAVALRPNFYEAHRELGYCYHLLAQTQTAQREYELADSNRGDAVDKDEVAGVNCALAVLHQQEAQTQSGTQKQNNEAASKGYWSDAQEITPDLKKAFAILGLAGLTPNIRSFVPARFQSFLVDPRDLVRGRIQGEIDKHTGGLGGLGGIIKKPKFPF